MKKGFRITIFAIIAAVLVVGYYFYLDRKHDDAAKVEAEKIEEVDMIVNRDLETNYPVTPREVVKFYNRIVVEYYANEHSDDEITAMASQQRKLLDPELLEYNPEVDFIINVKANIEEYAARDEKIRRAKVCSSNDVTYRKVKGDDCAYVTSYYFSSEGSSPIRTFQEYCLRKDTDGRWKILTFRLTEGDPNDYQ